MEYDCGATLGDILSTALKNREETITMSKATAESYAKAFMRAFKNTGDNGFKIEAIGMVRTYTDMGLKEAKDFVENEFKVPMIVGTRVRYAGSTHLYTIVAVYDMGGGNKYYMLANLSFPNRPPFTPKDSNDIRLA